MRPTSRSSKGRRSCKHQRLAADTSLRHLCSLPIILALVVAGCSSSATHVRRSQPKRISSTAYEHRPIHAPPLRHGQCPRSPGRFVRTADFATTVVGRGPVQVGIADVGNPRHGFYPGRVGRWLALKTHFFSRASYSGPFEVRAVSPRGTPIRLGSSPSQSAPLLVPAGGGSREVEYFTFVKKPGCYGWAVDAPNFSELIIARVLSAYRAPPGSTSRS